MLTLAKTLEALIKSSQLQSIEETDRRCRQLARVAGWLVSAIGVLVLIGWVSGQQSLMSVLPGAVSMKANTAMGFVLAGLALTGLAAIESGRHRRGSAVHLAVCGMAALVWALGAASGSEYMTGWNFGIDQLLFRDTAQAVETYYPGRMSPFTALNFVCVGSALLLVAIRRMGVLSQVLAGGVAFLSMLILMGSFFGVSSLFAGGRFTATALHTNVAFGLLAAGILAAQGHRGIITVLLDRGAAGTVTRRLAPAAIVVPVLTGWLRLWGERNGLFGAELGMVIVSLSNIVTFSALVWWSAQFLRRSELVTQQAQGALQDSLKRYSFLADALPQMIWTASPDGRIDYWNKAWFDYSGLNFEPGKEWDRGQAVCPEDRPALLERWNHCLAAGELHEAECRLRRLSDGADRWHLDRALPLRNQHGQIVQWVGTCTDIDDRKRAGETLQRAHDDLGVRVMERTSELAQALESLRAEMRERERAEHANQLIFEHSLDVIFTIDQAGRFGKVSCACEKLWGYLPGEMSGQLVIDFVAPDDRAMTARFLEEVVSGQATTHFENRFLRKDATAIPVVWTANWSATDELMFCVARDMSERKAAEVELQMAKDSAEAANRAKSRFLANMSHEIRTPMNGVMGLTNLLLETALSSDQRDYIEMMRTSGENLLALINDILDFSKVEAGKLTVESSEFALRNAVEETLELMAATAQSKGLELTALIAPGVPLQVRGDVTRLQQVLTNLISNAIKFTSHGEVTLRVALEGETGTHATVGFAVHDTGIGIEMESQGGLFQAFSQADVSTTRKFGGSGLGLAISKQLVELMGGSITMESRPHEGSVFRFALPMAKPPDASEPNPLPGIDALAGKRVLVVANHPISSEFLQLHLSAWQMPVVVARTAPEALLLLRRAARDGVGFSVAIIDSVARVLDGLALSRAIKADGVLAQTRLILLTPRGLQLSEQELRAAGIAQSRSKPMRQATLLNCVVQTISEAPAEMKTAAGERVEPLPGHPARILIAEDNPVNQRVAFEQLRKLGYAADLAVNGREVLEAMQRVAYDIILMDCQMPEMDGFETTAALRKAPAGRVWIIAMTANAMSGDRELCLAAGMDDYLSKPVRAQELAEALDRAHAQAEAPAPV